MKVTKIGKLSSYKLYISTFKVVCVLIIAKNTDYRNLAASALSKRLQKRTYVRAGYVNPFLEKFISYDNLYDVFTSLVVKNTLPKKDIEIFTINLEENIIQMENKVLWWGIIPQLNITEKYLLIEALKQIVDF